MKKIKKGYFIYIPMVLIILIQLIDKDDSFVIAQYVLLGVMVVALLARIVS